MFVNVQGPCDIALVLAGFVRSMWDYYLAVGCRYGAGRVIALEAMARDRLMGSLTLPHVALKLACKGCHTGPDEVHLSWRTVAITSTEVLLR